MVYSIDKMEKDAKKSKLKPEVGHVRVRNKILRLLWERGEKYPYQREISRILNLSETRVKGHLDRLERKELIKFVGIRPKFPELTPGGRRTVSQILDVSFNNLKFRCHNFRLTAGIIHKPENWKFNKPQFKAVSDEIRMTNWKLQKDSRWNDNFFLISNSSISLRIKDDIIASTPVDGAFQALEIFTNFAQDMESYNSGLRIGKPYTGSVVILSSQEFAVRLPNSSKFNLPYIIEIFHIDWSKGYAEIDFLKLDDASKFHEFICYLLSDRIDLGLIEARNLTKIYEFCKITIPNQSENLTNSTINSPEQEQSKNSQSSSLKSQEEEG